MLLGEPLTTIDVPSTKLIFDQHKPFKMPFPRLYFFKAYIARMLYMYLHDSTAYTNSHNALAASGAKSTGVMSKWTDDLSYRSYHLCITALDQLLLPFVASAVQNLLFHRQGSASSSFEVFGGRSFPFHMSHTSSCGPHKARLLPFSSLVCFPSLHTYF